MSVSTTTIAIRYDGNGSTVTPYPITFPFLNVDHVKVSLQAAAGGGEVIEDLDGTLTGHITNRTAEDTGVIVVESNDFEEGAVYQVFISGGGFSCSIDVKKGDTNIYNSSVHTEPTVEVPDEETGASFVLTIPVTCFESGASTVIEVTEADPPVVLEPGDYTVTRLADGSGGSLVTAAEYSEPAVLTIYRSTPLTQPTTFPLAGPLPSSAVETALDRLLMQAQELSRRIAQLEGVATDDYVQPPSGSPTDLRGMAVWDTASTRSSKVPNFIGQLGVQYSDRSVWVATGLSGGAWALDRPTWQKEWRAVAPGTEIVDGEYYLGTLSEATAVKTLFVAVASDGTNDQVTCEIFAGEVSLATVIIAEGVTYGSAECVIPTTIIPVGTKITAQVENLNYGSAGRKGLDIVLTCRHV